MTADRTHESPHGSQAGSGAHACAAHRPDSGRPARTVAGGYFCPMCAGVEAAHPGSCPHCGMALERTPGLAAEGGEYVCPMHPQVVAPAPGSCPICGMALEPRIPLAADDPAGELGDMTRRFWIALVFAAPVLLIAMGEMLPPLAHVLGGSATKWLELALSTPAVLWAGAPLFARAWASIVNGRPNMFTLIGLGTGAAYVESLMATLAPGLFPAAFRDHSGNVPVYFEAAAVITALVLLGQVLELRARAKTGDAIRDLIALAPKTARRVRGDGADEDVPVAELRPGDRLRVRPGDKIPVDGVGRRGDERGR